MESDLSLIEISGEDDSLLQQIPSDDVSNNYFSCSPLQFLRSKRSADSSCVSQLEGMKGDEHAEKPSFSSPSFNSNKENTNANKSEVLKFGEKPQQMKRRKKGGGYDLRKSLAWNRAFFTEEGVLDPLELSMISGTFNKSSGGMLSVIHEEGRKLLSGDSNCTSDSVDLQAVEGNLFKGPPGSTPNQGKKIGGHLLPKHDSSARDNEAPASLAIRKVLSAHDVNRSGSKRGGCQRTLASSSQKKPANASTTKAVTKDSKLPKILVSKPPCLLPMTAKSAKLGASCANRNQTAQQAVKVQKSVGLKGSSNNTLSAQNNANAGPDYKSLSSKTSLQPSRRNMANSPLEIPSSSNLRPPLVTKSNNGFEVIPDPVPTATGSKASKGHDKSSKVALSVPKNANSIAGNMQYAQLQAAKPSGLRMPSPSLGLFDQPKASASQNLLQRSTQPCNSSEYSIPNSRKLGATNTVCERRTPCAPGKMLKVANNLTTTRNIRGLSSSRECSVPSAVNSVLHENKKSNLEANNLQKVEVKVPYEPKGSKQIYNQQQLYSILDDVDKKIQEHTEPCNVEEISCKGDTELQMNCNKLPLQSGSHEQWKKDNDDKMVADACTESRVSSGDELENLHFTSKFSPLMQVESVSQVNDMIEHQQVEDKQYNLSVQDHNVISESQSGDAIGYSNQGMHHDSLRSTDDVSEQSGEPAELIKSCFHEADQVSHVENQRLQSNDGIFSQESRSSEESQKYSIADFSVKVRGLEGSELNSLHGPSQFKYIEQANEGAVREENMTIKSHVADAQVQSSDCNLLVESCISNVGTFAAHNQCVMVDGVNEHSKEQPELQSPCLVERVSQDCHGLRSNDFCTSKLENPHFMSQLSPMVRVEVVSGTNDLIEQQHVEDNQYNLSVKNHGVISESQSPDAIGYNQGTLIMHNNCGMHDVNEQSGEQSELIKSCTCEADQISYEENQKLKAKDGILIEESRYFEEYKKYNTGNIANVSPNVRGSSGSKLETAVGSAQLNYTDQGNEGAAGAYNMTEESHAGDVAVQQSSDDNLLAEGCKFCNSNLKTSVLPNKCLMVVDDINRQSGEQFELRNPCCSSEDSQEENVLESVEIVVSERSDACGSESKSSEVFTWVLPTVQDGGAVDVDKVAEHPHLEDAPSSNVVIEPSVENQMHFIDAQLRHDIEFSGQATLECDSFLNMNNDKTPDAVTTGNFKAFCSLIKESGSSFRSVHTLSNGSTLQVIGVNGLKSNILPRESSTNDPHEENQTLQRNNGVLFEESRCFEESQKEDSGNVADVCLKVQDSCGSKLEGSHGPSQLKYTEQANEGASGVDNMTGKSHAEDAQVQSLAHNVITESGNCNLNSSEVHSQYVMVIDDVSEQSGEHPEKSLNAFCSLSEESRLLGQTFWPSSNRSVLQGVGINGSKSKTRPEEAGIKISQNLNCPKGEMEHELDDAMSPSEDKDATMLFKKSGHEVKQDALVIKPPPNAVPFSDEWLAAIEAAGEDILTLKTGAVQNSPPDKSIPEPGPWSPVRRKNNEVGPFDCTKFTNIQPSSSL